jgi:uncharacterized protein (DUF2141 family)
VAHSSGLLALRLSFAVLSAGRQVVQVVEDEEGEVTSERSMRELSQEGIPSKVVTC